MINVDILMRLEDDKGAIEAESQSFISTKDEFTKEFVRPMYFDVEEFDFDMGLEDDDDSDSTNSSTSSKDSKDDKKKKKAKARFNRWLGGQRNLKTDGYPVEMQPFGFTRQFDWASPTLFQLCANSTSLKQATMVQRKAGSKTIDNINMCFLRIDFFDVLLIGVSWDLADAVLKEKVKFICRGIKVQYKVQDEGGVLYATNVGEWSLASKLSK